MKWLIVSIFIFPFLTGQQQSGQKIYPLDHIRGVFMTNLILEFLYNNKTIPINNLSFYEPAMKILHSSNQCQLCHKQFTNSSYLALHYSIKHKTDLFEEFKPSETLSFQIIFTPYSNLPQQQIYQECLSFFKRLKDRVVNQKQKFGKHFEYVRDHEGDQFCEIVEKKYYEVRISDRIIQVVGFSVLIISAIGYLLYRIETSKINGQMKRSKRY